MGCTGHLSLVEWHDAVKLQAYLHLDLYGSPDRALVMVVLRHPTHGHICIYCNILSPMRAHCSKS